MGAQPTTGTKLAAGATTQTTVASPSNTTSTAAFVMVGLAGTFTPSGSGAVLIAICGQMGNTTTGDGTQVQISYGTGGAPANGAALTGTQVGPQPQFTALTGVLNNNFCVIAIVTGLTPGTAYWIDLAAKTLTGGASTLANVGISVHEF